MKIIIGLLMLCIIVTAHEFGHLIVAKLNHIDVKEFWIGFGPGIFNFEVGGTKYCLRLIPLGGACVFDTIEDTDKDESSDSGDDSDESVADEDKKSEEDKNEEDKNEEAVREVKYDKKGRRLLLLNEAGVWARIATYFAGPLFNFILAFLMGLVVVTFSYMPSATVTSVVDGSPAQKAGLEAGDSIVKINGSRVYLYPEVSLAVQAGIGRPLNLTFERNGQRYRCDIIPEMNDESGTYMIGVTFGGEEIDESMSFGKSVTGSFKYVRYMIKMTYLSLDMLLTGKAQASDVSGPVGVVSIVSREYDAAAQISPLAIIVSMLNIAVLISANLGVINLLPFPALDGGRLVFAIYEAITGRKVDARIEGFIHFLGSALLVILMIFVLFNDLMRLLGFK